jgi:phosphohistidine phosphatase
MKTLFLIRHAKSSQAEPGMKDFDRPLNDRGKKDAPLMGKILHQKKIKPDLLISSPAKRALSTAQKIAKEIDYPKAKIKKEAKIYEASVKTLLHIVNEIEDKNKNVFLFGHNPGFTDFLNYLTGDVIENIPTCGIAEIKFDADSWSEISRDTGKLVYFDSPKKNEED